MTYGLIGVVIWFILGTSGVNLFGSLIDWVKKQFNSDNTPFKKDDEVKDYYEYN